MMDMAHIHANDTAADDTQPARVTLTTDRVTSDGTDALAAALYAAGVVVARRTFLPTREDVAHPWGVLLLAVDGPSVPLAQLVAPATASIGVFPALMAALKIGEHPTPATLQLKADGMFVSIRSCDLLDITTALDGLPARLACFDTHREERRLVYSESSWHIDP